MATFLNYNRIVFVDQMDDRREIKIDPYGNATTLYNGEETGKFFLHEDEIETIMSAENESQAFAVVQSIEEK